MDDQTISAAALPPLMRPGGELSTAAAAALCEHPNFAEAMRAVLTENVRLYRGNRVLNYVGYDRGRLVVAMLAFYLHASRRPDDPTSGLTAQSLKSLCVEQEVCSPGRARAMLSLMRLFGYVASAPEGDRRFKLLVPTELLMASLRQRWGAMFAAMAPVLPEGAAAGEALTRDDFLGALVRSGMDQYRSGVRLLRFAPELRLFAERNAGLMILFSLVIAAEPGDTMPPIRPVRVSISELARRFSVSRVHVGRLLRDAEAAGLIERTASAPDAITLLPPLSRALRHATALMFLFFAHCARAAMAEVGEESRRVLRDGLT